VLKVLRRSGVANVREVRFREEVNFRQGSSAARTEKIEGSTAGTGDSAASETRIPNLGVAVMDEISSAIVTG
jgi:hypothetical protein